MHRIQKHKKATGNYEFFLKFMFNQRFDTIGKCTH